MHLVRFVPASTVSVCVAVGAGVITIKLLFCIVLSLLE